MQSPKIYVIILNYRQWEDARDCLASVLKSTYTNYLVFVIDNASGNGSLQELAAYIDKNGNGVARPAVGYRFFSRQEFASAPIAALPAISFIQSESNSGFAAGNNIVIDKVRNEDGFIWLLNPDMTIQADTMSEPARYGSDQPHRSVIGSVVKFHAGNRQLLFYGGGIVNFSSATVNMVTDKQSISKLGYISGGSLFTHANSFSELGLLPEQYFLYWEETDWCFRARNMGYQMKVCETAICYDKVSTVIGKSFMADYYYVRNGLLFTTRYKNKNMPVVLFFTGIRYLKRIFTGRWDRARGVWRGTMDYFKMKRDENK